MFIIPLAGLSSRFFKEGYTKPKYQLDLKGETVFSWSVKSFEKYFDTDKFVFIFRDFYDTKNFIEEEIKKLKITNYELICLLDETLGQADTVYQGLCKMNNDCDEEIYIFNIDSKIINFIKPSWTDDCDGYLEVFRGDGEHWSFAESQKNSNLVSRTAEKERISDLCSDGLYFFKNISLFKNLFLKARENNLVSNNEYYVAPLYNILIQEKGIVRYDLKEKRNILFCGTPYEYKKLLEE
ncbi:capsular biosynthesis protein [Gallibacterium genomosp. 2]|uniref:Capsular biosynthesis protein n=1 Tax=Gallibacterium genomosp. 2 TaxID=155517 RepID=A0A0A2XM81_9PAST|nr:glycosyltransferase family 2 protein [Gallibacterium genomosp. 2]KGQ33308.1 capsular biosynthesis protein [Gallibacterium genomosp. 2]